MSRGLVCPRPPQYATAPECTLARGLEHDVLPVRAKAHERFGRDALLVVLRRLIDLIENRMIVVGPGSIGKAWWSAIQRKTDREGMTAS